MSAEVNPSVEEEVPQEVATQPTETENVQEKPKESSSDARRRNDKEYNWAEARRKMQELEDKNRELAEKVGQIQRPASDVEDELDKLADDDIITKGQTKKLAKKMAMEIAQEVIKQREAATVDERLSLRYPDFAQVVSRENIETLKELEPELALTLSHNPDPYAQSVAAYKLLKKLGYGEEVAKSEEKDKALKNSQKPVSVNAATKQSAIGNAHLFENGLSKELKDQLWKEMQECKKRS